MTLVELYRTAFEQHPRPDAFRTRRNGAWQDVSSADAQARIEQVVRMVLDTKKHTPTIPGSAEIIDLDLSSIASDWPIYERNRKNIRREYDWVPEEEFLPSVEREIAFFNRFVAS